MHNNDSDKIFTAEDARWLSDPKHKNETYAVHVISGLIQKQAAHSTVRFIKVIDFDFDSANTLNVFQEKILKKLNEYGYGTEIVVLGGGFGSIQSTFLHITW